MSRFFLALISTAVLFSPVSADEKSEKAPDKFRVKVTTSKGDFIIEVTREWAPLGADRFHELVKKEFYKEARFFRVLPGFVAQFGMHADPKIHSQWVNKKIKDDPKVAGVSNKKGYLTYAHAGPGTRTTQLFINYGDNARLDDLGFPPFGRVIKGMEVVEAINAEYRQDPDQGQIRSKGNAYLKENFPNLDYIKEMKIVKE
ncbi:MAG TPA: peptidylprolyl isomerase [Planctomycetaceae bacterium]|mgnify:CR=1 FL=1|nr:peptidylprolyl isomerase [Planctomycetaceae bacterium]